MSNDPISKSKIGRSARSNHHIPKNQGKGTINTNKDYYSSTFVSLRSRIIFVSACLLPYLGIGVLLYLEGLKFVAITLLATPLVFFLVFWFINKNSQQ